MPSQIGAQLYTLRDYTKTPADFAKTLARVRKMGYEVVQASGHGPIDPAELARMLKGEGLTCAATHTHIDRLEKEAEKVLDEHAMWGCTLTAVGGFWVKDAPYTTQSWLDFAQRYNAVAKKLAGKPLKIGYHNHSHELAKFDGKPALDILMEQFDKSIWMEVDTYWIQHGGGDPVQWINKCKGRIPAVHFKDMGIHTDRTQFMAEVGEGNLNWSGILAACKNAGAQWYLVEQDVCYRDPFESLEISLKNLKGMGVQ